jgi:alkanesulfonate monooxygenase SsuD/methylene tetrahydromethanopterin reductase-like flavin-dependent oxidoreductase (luciferase family)
VQQPHPPIYLAAFKRRALERVATLADGWIPTGLPIAGIRQMMNQIRRTAEAAGRDPAAIQLIVLAHLILTDRPQGSARAEWSGSLDEILTDVEAVRQLGASELILNLGFSPSAQSQDGFLEGLEQLRRSVPELVAAAA